MSIPGLFPPIFLEGRLLVDGGVLNSIPIDLCRTMGADVHVAVDLKSFYTEQNIAGLVYHFYIQKDLEKVDKLEIPKKMLKEAMLKISFPFAILLRSVCIAEEAFRNRILTEFKPDLLVHPDVTNFSLLDTEKYLEIFAKGTEAGALALPQIKQLLTQKA
jgi:predicted acylesterase/phospholipase RssA